MQYLTSSGRERNGMFYNRLEVESLGSDEEKASLSLSGAGQVEKASSNLVEGKYLRRNEPRDSQSHKRGKCESNKARKERYGIFYDSLKREVTIVDL